MASFANEILIRGTHIAEHLAKAIRRNARPQSIPAPEFGITKFCTETPPKKRALLSLSPTAWRTAVAQAPDIEIFNIIGLTFEITKALNTIGYAVDIVDICDKDFLPQKPYDLYLGHGGHTGAILDLLPPHAFVIHYASGAAWDAFNKMSQERYDNFCARRGLSKKRQFVRSIAGTESGEERLARRADAGFLSGPRTVATFDGISKRMELLYLGAYVQKDIVPAKRDFSAGRRNFLCAGATSGNVQKGIDLIIETFARLPRLNLFIYCKVEKEILDAYARELRLPNIHYVYHYSIGPLRPKIRALLERVNFTFGAPIDTGPGTAMLGTLGLGLIPVGYIDIDASESESVLGDDFTVESLVDCALRASEKPAEWCEQASASIMRRFTKLHEPSQFGANFKDWLQSLGL